MATPSQILDELSRLKALEMIEDMLLVDKEEKTAWLLHSQQGQLFSELAKGEVDTEVKFAFALAAVQCFAGDTRLALDSALSLHDLATQIGSVLYHKKALKKAKECLNLASQGMLNVTKEKLERLKKVMEDAEICIAASKTLSVKDADSKIAASKVSYVRFPEPVFWKQSPKPDTDEYKEFRLYWVGLDAKIRRDFMKISIAKLKSFVKEGEVRDTLVEVLTSAKKDKEWIFWMCRTLCSGKFTSPEEYKSHVELEHGADVKLSSEKDRVQRIGRDWANKITGRDWEPVDVEAAVEMMKNQLEYVKAFARKAKNGWSKEWPVAPADEERSKLLKEIKLLLESLCHHRILSCSIRDWLMRFPVKHLGKLQVPEQSIIDSRILGTPQSICFLECPELCQIQDFLQNFKCERHDGIDLVCRAVDTYADFSQIKEKIDFDPCFLYLLLDKRLLKGNNATYDDKGTIDTFDPSAHYAKAPVQGDDIISWLVDYSTVDTVFPRPRREKDLLSWVTVMKAVQFTCKDLGTTHAKKVQVVEYEAALTVVEKMCMAETERRKNLPEDQSNRYASLLCNRCETRVNENSTSAKLFLCAVRDVLKGALHLTFDFPEGSLNLIREQTSLSDDLVLKHINLLRSVVSRKVLLIDAKILLIDNSRISLLNRLTRLSVFDNRVYMLQLLKPFLQHELTNMKLKDESEAADAELFLEDENRSQSKDTISLSKKKKNKKNKKTSTSTPSPLNKTVEQESSAENLEPEATSPPLRMVEEESSEPKHTLAGERGRLEILSNTDNEVDPGMRNMPGENSLSDHLGSAHGGAAARYNSALDITLKALLNIKIVQVDLKQNEQPSYDNLEGVTCALQKVFTAFKSEMLEGVYSILLSDLLDSLKEVSAMSGDAAELLATILQFWPCWKNTETESLVTRLFMWMGNVRVSCRNCRREVNDSEQSSHRIVMAADSIRDLKCAYGNMEFVDILKLIRMEDKMLCDIKKGGCGQTNFVHHIISTDKIRPIFTIVLQWEKNKTGKEVSETTKALKCEIDMSRLYEGLESNTNYRLASMVCCGEKDEHICIAYGNNRRFKLIHGSLAEEDVGNWESVIRFCEERKARPEILFYEVTSYKSII